MTRKRWIAASLPLLLAVLGAGCMLVSGQITVVQGFDPGTGSTTVEVNYLEVDLNENEDYADHKDKIASLETIGFVVHVTNLGADSASGEGYLGIDPVPGTALTPDDVKNSPKVKRILFIDDPIAPGETREISFEDSQAYIENFDWMEEAIKDGNIHFYGITDIGEEAAWDSLKIIATINVEL